MFRLVVFKHRLLSYFVPFWTQKVSVSSQRYNIVLTYVIISLSVDQDPDLDSGHGSKTSLVEGRSRPTSGPISMQILPVVLASFC